MKKINKSLHENELTIFADENSNGSWGDFRDSNSRINYKRIKNLIFNDQGYLCAYCEVSLQNQLAKKMRIEHFHTKSDSSDSSMNWSLDWRNVIGVCVGGEHEKKEYDLPSNKSCDSYKAYLEQKNELPRQCEGLVLNPLEIIATPALFAFERGTGELVVDIPACAHYTPTHNKLSSVEELVLNTIKVFNLNCDRLKDNRLRVFRHFESILESAKKDNDTDIHRKLAERWFRARWPSYFTTRRIILGEPAEIYLNNLNYNG